MRLPDSNHNYRSALYCEGKVKRQRRSSLSYQQSLTVQGPYIIDTLLLFQGFGEDDHHGNMWVSSSLFQCRGRPRGAILNVGGGQAAHVGEMDARRTTSHL